MAFWQKTNSNTWAFSTKKTQSATSYTYNSRYPWFDEEDYWKLEKMVADKGLTGSAKTQAMDQLYEVLYPRVLNKHKLDERQKEINQTVYDNGEALLDWSKDANMWIKLTSLAQKAKIKFDIPYNIPDNQIINDIRTWVPNGNKLLYEYVNNWNPEILKSAWIVGDIPQSTWWWMQSLINKGSEISKDTTLWKINNRADWINLIGKWTEYVDSWVQKIPVITFDDKVKNLVNKMNNLSDSEIGNLYKNYVKMVKNAKEWDVNDKWWWEMMWDWLVEWDQKSIDRLNTLQLVDYSEAMPQEWVERNQWGDQLWDKLWITNEEKINKNIEESDMNDTLKAWAKWAVRAADKLKNLLNFVWGSRWGLENYAEAAAVGEQKLDDIRNRRWTIPQDMENNEDAFEAYVANKTANFGEYLVDAPETLMWRNNPNMAKFIANMPWSFLKTLSSKIRWATNPLDSKIWLAKMLFTEEGQQAMINRYWDIDSLVTTMNTDPVWFASDIIDWWDKINRAFNKATWWAIERQNIGDITDALSSDTVRGINLGLNKTSDWMKNNWYNRTAWLVDIVNDSATNNKKLAEDVAKESGMLARDVYDAWAAAVDAVENVWKKLWEVSEAYKQRSAEVWDKVKDLPTRTIPEKIVENDLKLTPKERARVEKNGITAANFVLKEKIGWLDNEDKIVALQDIASDAYNKVTDTFKNKIPDDYREKSTVAPKMLKTMVSAMESSDIVKEEYGDYINKLKEMANYEDFSPYEKLAIRRDFDAIVWNDLFKKDGTLKADVENWIVAWWRDELNDEINEIGKEYWVDVKDENSRISNAITIRDWLIRSVSQWKKNNRIWLQDLWIGAILSAWNPVQAWWAMIAKKVWDAKSWNIAQSMYNMNNNPLKPANTKKWPGFIKKSNWNANNRFMISTSSDNTSSN